MRRPAAAVLWLLAAAATGGQAAKPTFCAEWLRSSREGFERLTVFSDRTVVWKTVHNGRSNVRRSQLRREELASYCEAFAKPDFWEIPSDLRTGLTGDSSPQTVITLVRPDGTRKEIRFDELSPVFADAASLRSTIEGLKGLFLSSAAPFCLEWIRQSREGYERLTLFSNGTVIWKTNRGGKEEIRRKHLAPEELTFYCDYFARSEVWQLASDSRTRLKGEFSAESIVTLARSDGARKTIWFDELSPLSPEGAALRSSVEGLRNTISSPLAPASRFSPATLLPGTLLKRFDGEVFRVARVEKEKGVVELEGVREPYREFRKIEELRFQFSPPE